MQVLGSGGIYPDPRADPESRAPMMVPYTTTGSLEGDLLSRSAQGSGLFRP